MKDAMANGVCCQSAVMVGVYGSGVVDEKRCLFVPRRHEVKELGWEGWDGWRERNREKRREKKKDKRETERDKRQEGKKSENGTHAHTHTHVYNTHRHRHRHTHTTHTSKPAVSGNGAATPPGGLFPHCH